MPKQATCNERENPGNALAFRNHLAVLNSLDRSELPWMSDAAWAAFTDHPCSYYLRCSDQARARIWAAIEQRRIRGHAVAA